MSNITQVVRTEKNMMTLKRGIIASGLGEVLSGRGPFTVFAPSDEAFGKLEQGVVENLLSIENKAKLTDLLNHHVVAGKIDFKDLKNGEKLKALSGKELSITIKEGKVSIDDCAINNRDIKTSNGVIHSLDTVLKN